MINNKKKYQNKTRALLVKIVNLSNRIDALSSFYFLEWNEYHKIISVLNTTLDPWNASVLYCCAAAALIKIIDFRATERDRSIAVL